MVAHTPPEGDEAAPPSRKGLSPLIVIGLVVLGLTSVVLASLILLGVFAPEALATARDIAIVFLAILFFFALLLGVYTLAVISYGINRLGERLDRLLQQVSEILEQLKGTATSVKGTASFVGERVAAPFIGVASWASGVGKGLKTLWQGGKQQEGGPS